MERQIPKHGQAVIVRFADHATGEADKGWEAAAFRVSAEMEAAHRYETDWQPDSILLRFNAITGTAPEAVASFFGEDWSETLWLDEADWTPSGWSLLLGLGEYPITLELWGE